MRKSRFTDEFKAEAIKQITERGHKVVDVYKRQGQARVWLEHLT